MKSKTAEEIFEEDKQRIAALVAAGRAHMVAMQQAWEGADTAARVALLPGLLEVQAGNPSYYNAMQVQACNNLKIKYPPKKQYYGVKTPAPIAEPEQTGQTAPDHSWHTERGGATVVGRPVNPNTGKAKGGESVQGLLF